MQLRYNQTRIKLILFLLPLSLMTVFYKLIQYVPSEAYYPALGIDSVIPYVPYFIIPYILFIPFIIIPYILLWKQPNDYKQMAFTYLLILIISELVYLTFQTAVIRPEIQPTSIFDQLVLMVYHADEPLNTLPSLHTSLSIAAALFIWRRGKMIGISAVILTILIVMSTLLIKQHVILDVITGTLLAFSSYYIMKIYDSRSKTRP